MRLTLLLGLVPALVACATATGGAAPADNSHDRAAFARAALAAGLSATIQDVEYAAVLTPAKPRHRSAALFAVTPPSWDAADGPTGSIGAPSNPYAGGHVGIHFKAAAGLRYLASCRLEQPGGEWHFNYGQTATGNGKPQPPTAELSMLSDPVVQSGTAVLIFAAKQTGHRIFSCNLWGLRLR